MSDWIFKLKVLWVMVAESARGGWIEWVETIYPYSPDDFYCCNQGDQTSPCGCGGATIRESFRFGR